MVQPTSRRLLTEGKAATDYLPAPAFWAALGAPDGIASLGPDGILKPSQRPPSSTPLLDILTAPFTLPVGNATVAGSDTGLGFTGVAAGTYLLEGACHAALGGSNALRMRFFRDTTGVTAASLTFFGLNPSTAGIQAVNLNDPAWLADGTSASITGNAGLRVSGVLTLSAPKLIVWDMAGQVAGTVAAGAFLRLTRVL